MNPYKGLTSHGKEDTPDTTAVYSTTKNCKFFKIKMQIIFQVEINCKPGKSQNALNKIHHSYSNSPQHRIFKATSRTPLSHKTVGHLPLPFLLHLRRLPPQSSSVACHNKIPPSPPCCKYQSSTTVARRSLANRHQSSPSKSDFDPSNIHIQLLREAKSDIPWENPPRNRWRM
ncbi:polymerase cofactor VP35 [Striga asiatica]|uniref:Polymerase cofactor VP35 n=1 Tax=Striga asiatica TaxID=4170 RepID=A0A5A7PED8_STRAF|nr:polymerase cofactor VP35 [Striga asiatica]